MIFAVDYLCYYLTGEIKLSEEHNSYRWLTLQELQNDEKEYFISESGFKLKDFEMAWKIYLKILS